MSFQTINLIYIFCSSYIHFKVKNVQKNNLVRLVKIVMCVSSATIHKYVFKKCIHVETRLFKGHFRYISVFSVKIFSHA